MDSAPCVALGRSVLAHRAQQPRFADPALPGQEHRLSLATLRHFPSLQQVPKLHFAANEGRSLTVRPLLRLRLDRSQNGVNLGIRRHAFQSSRTQGAHLKAVAHQPKRRRTDAYAVRRSFRLDARGQVGGLADRVVYVSATGIHCADDHEARMDPDARFDACFTLRSACFAEPAHAGNDAERRPDPALGIVVVRRRVPEKSRCPVADILVNVSAVAGDAVVANALIRAKHITECLGVQSSGECG